MLPLVSTMEDLFVMLSIRLLIARIGGMPSITQLYTHQHQLLHSFGGEPRLSHVGISSISCATARLSTTQKTMTGMEVSTVIILLPTQ